MGIFSAVQLVNRFIDSTVGIIQVRGRTAAAEKVGKNGNGVAYVYGPIVVRIDGIHTYGGGTVPEQVIMMCSADVPLPATAFKNGMFNCESQA